MGVCELGPFRCVYVHRVDLCDYNPNLRRSRRAAWSPLWFPGQPRDNCLLPLKNRETAVEYLYCPNSNYWTLRAERLLGHTLEEQVNNPAASFAR